MNLVLVIRPVCSSKQPIMLPQPAAPTLTSGEFSSRFVEQGKKCRGIDVSQSRIGIIISNIRLIEWKQSTKLRWSAFLNLKLWVSQRKDQLFFFFTGIIGDYKGLQSLLSRLGRLSRLNSKLVKVWYQKSWHYSCCDNDNNDDHNNSHYNISDWMRIKLFDECLGADGNICHQRQYSLLVKIFQKVVFVLSYIWKHASVKSSFPSHSVRHPFHPSSELLPPDVKKIWSSQLDCENHEKLDRSIQGYPFTNLCGFMAIHHQQCRWSQDKSVPVKGKKKARHQYRVITMLRHFPSDEPSPGFHWATISLFPSREGTPGVSSTVFHQGQRHQANHQQWPDLQEGHLEGK